MLTTPGAKTYRGLENAALTGKWQSITIPQSETVVSLGIIREFGGGYATVNVGGDPTGATSPTIYAGQGLGALPIGLARPLAITGELSYNIPDRRLNSAGDNGGQPFSWTGGASLQFSIPYLQQHLKHFDMPDFFSRLIPLVELDWFSPAGPRHLARRKRSPPRRASSISAIPFRSKSRRWCRSTSRPDRMLGPSYRSIFSWTIFSQTRSVGQFSTDLWDALQCT